MTDKTFVNGMIVKRRDNAPEYVLCNLSVKVDEFIAFAQEHQRDGWLNVNCMVAKSGKHYAELDTWQPTQGQAAKQGIAQARKAAEPEPSTDPFFDEDLPF